MSKVTRSDVMFIGGILGFCTLLIWFIFSSSDSICQKQLAKAKTSTDSTIVYASRPIPNGPTCSVLD